MQNTHATKRARSVPAASEASRRSRAAKWVGLTLAAAVIGAGAAASPALATPQGRHSARYQFQTINNAADQTFNQLLGINENGLIAGYFGSGAMGHPNKGYLFSIHHGAPSYQNENWPESMQTQVTGLNDHDVTVGFWSTMNTANQMNDNRAFVSDRGYFIDGDYPTDSPASPPVDQLLGVNDHNVAVGFYSDGSGNTHAYMFNIKHNQFSEVTPAGITNPTAAGIDNRGDIAGFGTDASNGQVVGFLLRRSGQVTTLSVPGSSMTQALGVNDGDEVVGTYQVGTGSNAAAHGFTWTPSRGLETVDDPNGVGGTTINGVNDRGQLVGFYTDSGGNTDGLLATPSRRH